MATSGNMISRPVVKIPTDPMQRDTYLQRVLNDMYQDIKTLFDTTTDNDRIEKLRRDNG